MTAPTPKVLHGIVLRPRPMIPPRKVVAASTPEEKQAVREAAKRVIERHRAVLMALKER